MLASKLQQPTVAPCLAEARSIRQSVVAKNSKAFRWGCGSWKKSSSSCSGRCEGWEQKAKMAVRSWRRAVFSAETSQDWVSNVARGRVRKSRGMSMDSRTKLGHKDRGWGLEPRGKAGLAGGVTKHEAGVGRQGLVVSKLLTSILQPNQAG